jgi:phosphoglycolate phosphatase
MTRPLTLILFDVDGTLIDSQEHIVTGMKAAFSANKISLPSQENILATVGLSLFEAFGQLCPDLDNAKRQSLIAEYKNSFASMRSNMVPSPLYPGALKCLNSLRKIDSYVLGIATGKSRRGLDYVLTSPDLAGRFLTEQVSDHHPSKPHPSMALRAMSDVGASRGVMVGDTSFDMEMGQAAGLKTIGVTWGYHSTTTLKNNADLIVDNFDELLPAITQILGEV